MMKCLTVMSRHALIFLLPALGTLWWRWLRRTLVQHNMEQLAYITDRSEACKGFFECLKERTTLEVPKLRCFALDLICC